MKFECDSCHAQYMIADEKVGKRGVKVKCKKCQHVIIVRPDGVGAKAGESTDKGLEAPATASAPAETAAAAPAPTPSEARPAMSSSSRKSERNSKKAADKAERAEKAAEKAAIELPLETLAAPPPPGLDFAADNEGTEAFAHGGPTDPSTPAMPGAEPPAPPPMSDESGGPEMTGPNMPRPAPISMFGDQTQLTQNPLGRSDEVKKLDDRTELGQPPSMSLARPDSGATQVTQRDPPRGEPPPPPPPAPPSIAMPAGPVAAMPSTGSSGDDALGDQLNGAFNAMFDAAPPADLSAEGADGDQRGPTRILDASAVDALRKNAAAQRPASDTVRSDDHGLSDEGFVVKPSERGAAGADDGPPDQVWHVAIDDQDVGPLSLAEVGRHIEGGRVDRESLVWKTGMDDWLPAGDVGPVRALFDKVPMPRIARVEEEPAPRSFSASSGPGFAMSGDLGAPIDDGRAPAPSGASPFDDGDDPSWRPHGLTDVYQAANLAETAGAGMGGMGMGVAIGSSKPSPSMSTSAEPEWRPAAASALASLVNDEIKRLDHGPPPASDDDLSPADDASINAPLFGGMGMDKTLEAGPEVSDPMGRAPATARGPGVGFDRPPPSPSFPPSPGFMSTPPQPGMSPLLIGGIVGGGLLVLAVVVLVALVALKGGDDPKIVMVEGKPYVQGADGKITPLNGSEKPAEAPAEKAPLAATLPKALDGAVAVATPAANGGVAPAAPGDVPVAPVGVPVAESKPPDQPKGDTVAVAPPPPDKERKATTTRVREKREEPPKREDPPPKVNDKPSKEGSCDPVLDFDCKAGKPSASSEKASAKEPLKERSKADVLVVVKANMAKVEGCGRKNKVGGVIKMSWKIQPNGKTTEVQVADSKFAGTPVGTCVASEIKTWKFTAASSSTPVSFPMKLGG